jgi:hypothetical protein
VLLPDHLVEALGAQTLGERRSTGEGFGSFRIKEVHAVSISPRYILSGRSKTT